jgi:hypothetical protein
MYKNYTIPALPRQRSHFKSMLKRVLLLVVLSVCNLHLAAFSFAQRVTISRDNAKLEDVLKDLQKLTTQNIFYDQAIISKQMTVSIKFKDAELSTVLESILTPHKLAYKTVDKNIIITRATAIAQQPSVDAIKKLEITGKVLDEIGLPLIGVTVK